MAWALDPRFRTADNHSIIAFIERVHPSAHDDIASVLLSSAKGLPDVRSYCPDLAAYAYVVLHTRAHRIFAVAFGMSALAFRLPASLHADALADGGRVYPEIGEDWILWEGWAPVDTRRWCQAAHDAAVAP